MYDLKTETDEEWVECVLDDFDTFLVRHAAAERKAGSASEHFAVRYHDKPVLIDAMLEVARDELEHFHRVFRLLRRRGGSLGPDRKDPYVNRLLGEARSSGMPRLLDRLVVGSIVEFRGCERFAMLSRGLEAEGANEELVEFYRELAADDSRHRAIYWEMALHYFDGEEVEERVARFLDLEAEILDDLSTRPALY
jgi:tRNA-(ms[2]io[6]A)-hydroxylase